MMLPMGASPALVTGASWNAFPSNQQILCAGQAPPNFGKSLSAWPGTTLALRLNCESPVPTAEFAVMVRGAPDWKRVIPLSSQPPSAPPTKPLLLRNHGDCKV